MTPRVRRFRMLVVALLVCTCGHANAQLASSAAPAAGRFPTETVIALGKQVERELAARGARVAIIARNGRPPSVLPAGIRYTHTAFAVYSAIARKDGTAGHGYAIYNLYQDADRADTSYLAVDYPADFLRAVAELRVGIIVPVPRLQSELLKVIDSPVYASLHNPRYSVMSNPFDTRYQNCTEYVLDVIQSALYGIRDRNAIKRVNAQYFAPQPVYIPRGKLWLGSLVSRGVSLDDHDRAPATATFTTIGNYLARYDLVSERFEIEATTGEGGTVTRHVAWDATVRRQGTR